MHRSSVPTARRNPGAPFYFSRGRGRCLCASLLSFALAMNASATPAPASDNYRPKLNVSCPEAILVPPDADDDVRRITCEIPGEFRLAVTQAEAEGQLLRRLDVAAWTSSDALVDLKAFEGIDGRAAGWLTVLLGDGSVDISYFRRIGDTADAVATAHFDAQTLTITDAARLKTPRPASAAELAQLDARSLAIRSANPLCTPPNTVIYESSYDGAPEITVFVLSSWTNDASALGGHHRYRMSSDGKRIVEHFKQTNACLNLVPAELAGNIASPITHGTSPTPTSIHAFLSRQSPRPLYVLTVQNGIFWTVDQGMIRILDARDPIHGALMAWKNDVLAKINEDENP